MKNSNLKDNNIRRIKVFKLREKKINSILKIKQMKKCIFNSSKED